MKNFTWTDLASECERELSMRELVYPKRVTEKRMKPETAERQLAMMRELARRCREMAQPQLGGGAE